MDYQFGNYYFSTREEAELAMKIANALGQLRSAG